MDREILERLKQNAILMKQLSIVDIGIVILNTEGIVEAFFPPDGKSDMQFEVGHQFEDKNDPIFEAMRTKRVVYNKVPKEVFGVTIEGKIAPIIEKNQVVGVMICSVETEQKDNILERSEELENGLEQAKETMECISEDMKNLRYNLKEIEIVADEVGKQVKDATVVVDSIQKNANYSNILALNASIESARAGQAGKGFAVVAEEMGKFSKASGESAKRISQTLSGIVNSLNQVQEQIEKSREVFDNQTLKVDEITTKYNQLTDIAQYLAGLTKEQANL